MPTDGTQLCSIDSLQCTRQRIFSWSVLIITASRKRIFVFFVVGYALRMNVSRRSAVRATVSSPKLMIGLPIKQRFENLRNVCFANLILIIIGKT
jgi:hypothetical protein